MHRPGDEHALQTLIRKAASTNRRLRIIPGGVEAEDNSRPDSELVCLSELDGIVDFPARDLTVTVRAGTPLTELDEALDKEHLQLPLDVPGRQTATVADLVAFNRSGPRRFGYGTVRDSVIGLRAVEGTGRVFSSGGRVVKNVAGYDLAKLAIGSGHQLAIVTEVTFKLRPRSESKQAVHFRAADWNDADLMLEHFVTSETRPVAVELWSGLHSDPVSGTSPLTLTFLYEGQPAEVDWQVTRIQQELRPLAVGSPEVIDGQAVPDWLTRTTDFQKLHANGFRFRAMLRSSRVTEFAEQAERSGWAIVSEAADGVVHGRSASQNAEPQAAFGEKELKRYADGLEGKIRFGTEIEFAFNSSPLTDRIRQTFDPHRVFEDSPGEDRD